MSNKLSNTLCSTYSLLLSEIHVGLTGSCGPHSLFGGTRDFYPVIKNASLAFLSPNAYLYQIPNNNYSDGQGSINQTRVKLKQYFI